MPLHRLEWTPGFNSQQTQTRNRAGWFAGNLVRWRYGLLEKVAGWIQLFSTAASGIVRALHAYEDLNEELNLLLAGDGGAQIYTGGTLYTFTFNLGFADSSSATTSINSGSKVVTVTQSNFGLLQIGGAVSVVMTVSIGGHIFHPGTTFIVTGITPHTSFTFNIPSNATRTETDVNPTPEITLANGQSPTVKITLNDHGLITGNSFTFDQPTNVQQTFGSDGFFVTIPAGSVVLVTVIDTDNFTFDGSPYGFWFGSADGVLHEGDSIIGASPGPVTFTFSPFFEYSGTGPSPNPDAWWLDNFGTYGLVTYTDGPLYIYTPPINASPVLNNAGIPDPSTPGSGSPQVNNGAFVAMPQAQIIAMGSEVILGGGQQDPLLLRWSDAGSYTVWTATASNQAGSFHLGGSGTKIVGGCQAPQTTLIWTNNDLWSMLYVGAPFIYSFTTLASQCGLIAPHAFAILGRTTIWMSTNSFFTFSDSGVTPIECPLWDIIFTNLNQNYINKIFLGTSQSTNEVWIFYPSSSSTGECDSYLKVNLLENLWDSGSLGRSAWLAENAFGNPLGAEWSTLLIQQHERGYDANGQVMAGVYAETGYADIADGQDIMFIDEFIPDMKWFGSDGAVGITMYGVDYPGDSPVMKGPYIMDSTNRYIRPELRKRQIALRFDWLARTGFSARLGTPRVRAFQAGSRP